MGDNARNATIAVNGGNAERSTFTLSGGNWDESGCLVVEADGFVQGANNMVVIGGFGNATSWAPDVGIEILELSRALCCSSQG
jgi:alpha-galactosidase